MQQDARFRWGRLIRYALYPVGLFGLFLVVQIIWGLITYPPVYVIRVLRWGDSDVFDWQKFPSHKLTAAARPSTFDLAEDPAVPSRLAELAGVEDWDTFLMQNHTQTFLVVRDGKVVYQGYFNQTRPDSIVTSFSVAKSFTSALIGIAIEEGAISSVDDPVTDYLPELAVRDVNFERVTIRDLLRMASGLEYQEMRFMLLSGDDPLTTYYPDQRCLALNNTHIDEPPGQHFQYNKYHPQLLGMILERTTGMSVTSYMQTKLWTPLGMAYDGSWSTDSLESDFEKMETGVNARALDFAKFGQLYLQGGAWQGRQVVPQAWVAESTQPWPVDLPDYYPAFVADQSGGGYYGYMWWGLLRPDGYDFSAEGDKGQFIYVSPSKRLVIVRNGTDFGLPSSEWVDLFYRFASDL
jgi:CubicO group peptidase (beta-lactamase class C family)